MKKKNISYLVSGRGSNFKAISQSVMSGEINGNNTAVISDKKDAEALVYARDAGINAYFTDPKAFASRELYETEICRILKSHNTDLICAAGYMRIISPFLINQFRGKIMNIHPSLLPSFPGLHAQKQAIDYGVKISGCTVHFVDEGTDTGPVILQSAVPVMDDDTEQSLSARILREEHKIYSEAVRLYCLDLLLCTGRSVSHQK